MKRILFIFLGFIFSIQLAQAQSTTCIDSSLINPTCICPMIYMPVCGCNGIIYSNDCLAQCDGVTSWASAIGPGGSLLPCSPACAYLVDVTTVGASNATASDGVISFNILSVSGGIPPYTIDDWTYNGTPISVTTPTNTMTGAAGVYCVTITDSLGCDTTICDSILIDCSFSGASVIVAGATMYAGASTSSDYDVLWSNGDTMQQITFYQNWCVTLTDSLGCDTTICDTVTYPPCNLSATVFGGPSSGTLTAYISSGTPPYTYNWSNGATTQNTSWYNPWCLEITDGLGCDTLICDSVVIIPPSDPCSIDSIFAEVGSCDSLGYVYVDISFVAANTGGSGFQILGNGNSYGPFTYGSSYYTVGPILADGTTVYTFTVQDVDSLNCSAVYTLGTIDCPPDTSCEAFFISDDQGFNLMSFENLSVPNPPPTGFMVEYDWSYGDGTIDYSVVGDTSHQYMSSGTYTVCLTMTMFDSLTQSVVCVDTYCETITLGGSGSGCQAAFTVNTNPSGLPALTVLFSNSSTATGSITSYMWDFGDGSFSATPSPAHSYAAEGNYLVCLTITTSSPFCTSTACDTIKIENVASSIIESEQSIDNVQLFPNPANEQLNVLVELKGSAMANITIYNTVGERLKGKDHLLNNGANLVNIAVHDLPTGVYFVNVSTLIESNRKRLVIVR